MVSKLRLALQLLAGAYLSLAACTAGGEEEIAPDENGRCGYRWTIPPQHVGAMPGAAVAGPAQWLMQTLRGGEVHRDFNVYWSSAHLAKHVPGYRRTVEGVDANILTTVLIGTRAQPDYLRGEPGSPLSQIFTRSGMYEHYVVDANPYPPGHYRIHNPEVPRLSWRVSKIDPRDYDSHMPVRDWLLASCTWRGGYLPDTERFVSCRFLPRIAQDITLSVRLRGDNIDLHEAVIAHMAGKLRSWVRVPEDDPHCFDDPFEGFP